jgi:hypothetical protein
VGCDSEATLEDYRISGAIVLSFGLAVDDRGERRVVSTSPAGQL